MPSGQLDDVVRHLRRLTGLSEAQRLTDGQLLERYLSCRDENAFAALVYRYGRLVRSVCRHILHQEQDIDDAFQVTFLIFARKADSIRKASSVASWLYGVAYRTAMNAKRTLARRREKQRVPNGPSREQPFREASLREVQAILDEEVQRLAEKYRAPFILCCLEGKSRAEIAEQLGLKEGTVSSRLAQARKQLQQRLTRRGVVLSAALCAVELSRASPAVSAAPMLMKGTIEGALAFASGKAAATNLISAEAAAMAKGVLQTMSAATFKTAAAVLLTISLLAGGSLFTCHVLATKPPLDKPATVPAHSSARKGNETHGNSNRDNREVTNIRGRVLDPDGKPVTGARLYFVKPLSLPLRYYPLSLHYIPYRPDLSKQATTEADGCFRFAVPTAELVYNRQDEAPPKIMAVADGFGCYWSAIDPTQEHLTLRLVKDVPLRLRVLDLNGRPVAGAKVTVTGMTKPKSDDLDGSHAAGVYATDRLWYGSLPQQGVVTTGGDGRFHLAGVGRERIVTLRIEGPGIASAVLDVLARATDTVTVTNVKKGYTLVEYSASSDYVAAASRPIRGVARDKKTGKPLAGVTVMDTNGWIAKAVSDKQGRFELLGVAKKAKYSLVAQPPDGSYFQRRVEMQDTLGLDPMTCDIDLVRGLTVRGRVTDKETGEPIADAQVEYYPLGGNPYVNKLLSGAWSPKAQTTTGADGSYALTGMTGPGALTVTAPGRAKHKYMPAAVSFKERKHFFKTPLAGDIDEDGLPWAWGNGTYSGIRLYLNNAVVLLEPDKNEKMLVRDIAFQKPLERKGRVLGRDGQPLAGVRVLYLNSQSDVQTLTKAEFTVRNVNPRAYRPMVFYHKEKNLGYYLKDLRNETAEMLTIKLQPCGSASGRILNPDGEPMAGLRCNLSRHEGNAIAFGEEGGGQKVTTDKDGRFRIAGLVPGQEYLVTYDNDQRVAYLAAVVVEPGEHKEMGDLKMRRIE